MENLMLRLRNKKRNVKETMRVQKALLKELGKQGMSVGQAAWFFNFLTLGQWRFT